MSENQSLFSIAAVERETGLGKDTLRVWEKRYGFPAPSRDVHGERLYCREQVDKLRQVKRLMDKGLRPGKIFATPEDQWGDWLPQVPDRGAESVTADALIELVRMQRSEELRRGLQQLLMKQGIERFVVDTVAPLNVTVGEAWMRGDISVADEHLYTEQVQNILRGAIAGRSVTHEAPRILLTTLPEEQHSLGLLMAEALLVSEGAQCVSLGTCTPLADIVHAAGQGNFDVVALSFAATFPRRHAIAGLKTLATQLPGKQIWAGGRGVSTRPMKVEGVRIVDEIAKVRTALHDWRAAHGR